VLSDLGVLLEILILGLSLDPFRDPFCCVVPGIAKTDQEPYGGEHASFAGITQIRFLGLSTFALSQPCGTPGDFPNEFGIHID
jgi:hypothetical protein